MLIFFSKNFENFERFFAIFSSQNQWKNLGALRGDPHKICQNDEKWPKITKNCFLQVEKKIPKSKYSEFGAEFDALSDGEGHNFCRIFYSSGLKEA